MRSPMDERTFLNFYKNTVLGYSKGVLNHICARLENERRISFEAQRSLDDSADIQYFESKRDLKKIISDTSTDIKFAGFYEAWEFSKLFKYSVPLFFATPEDTPIKELLVQRKIRQFEEEKYRPEMILNTSLKDSTPLFWENDGDVFLKFVLQKDYLIPETFEPIDYRYPIVVYFNVENSILEIRYDAMKYGTGIITSDGYEQLVTDCISWLKKSLDIELYLCDHTEIISVINDKQNEEVKIYKQLMELSTGGSAELTASESADYVLPFIGEIRELIEENEEIFNQAEDIKKLLLQYLADKEATASYPYIYIKWVNPVESQSYIVKVTFDYLNRKYTLLQHITGSCKDLGMERMNNAIKYLCKTCSFVKGEEI